VQYCQCVIVIVESDIIAQRPASKTIILPLHNNFAVRVVKPWNSLSEEVVTSPRVRVFESRLDKTWKWNNQPMKFNYKEELWTQRARVLCSEYINDDDELLNNLLAYFVVGTYFLNEHWSDTSVQSANISPNQISLWYSLNEIIKHSTFKYRLDLRI